MISTIKENIITDIKKAFAKLDINESVIIEKPKDRKLADYSIPCFNYAKILHMNPNEVANKINENIESNIIEKTVVVNSYLNLFLNKKIVTKMVLEQILKEQEHYGDLNIGENKTVAIDYSAPNIAKPFGVGHLRSTVIGNSLKNIYNKLGYKTVGINYIGDYGTQFGKLLYAYKTWGNEEKIKNNPIEELKNLYVKFHEEASKDPSLEEEGRRYFKMIEDKDKDVIALWAWIRDESLKAFMKTYNLLGINNFDSYDGEAFYADKTEPIINELKDKELLVEDDGAMIVRLGDDMAPALITKSDGTSLYITRDLAAIFYRKNKYQFDKILYVVGNEQTLHFKQVKKLIEKMGYSWANDIDHISFGMVLQDGKKMSTRHGRTSNLHEVLEESIELANQYISEKNPALDNKEETSKIIGVGAVIFNDLKNYRTGDVEFNLKDILKFEGETGPYIQYTYVRINSMLENIKNMDININNIGISEYIWNIIMKLLTFEEVLIQAGNYYDPSQIAKYILDLAQDYNKLYANERIVGENTEESEFKLQLSKATALILKEGMSLLGIKMPIKM